MKIKDKVSTKPDAPIYTTGLTVGGERMTQSKPPSTAGKARANPKLQDPQLPEIKRGPKSDLMKMQNALKELEKKSPQERAKWMAENHFNNIHFLKTAKKAGLPLKEPLKLTPAEQEMADSLGL